MIINFNFGIIYKNVQYGWYKKQLYRLPHLSDGGYNFGLKKLNQIMVGNKVGYRLSGDKKTFAFLESVTHKINYIYDDFSDESDCPF